MELLLRRECHASGLDKVLNLEEGAFGQALLARRDVLERTHATVALEGKLLDGIGFAEASSLRGKPLVEQGLAKAVGQRVGDHAGKAAEGVAVQ